MAISAQLVKELREKTGAGIMDSKKALEATNGNIDEAIKWLREKGIAKAVKKADRIAAEGLTGIVQKGDKAVIYELNSETDFVANNQKFLDLVKKIGDALVNSDVKNIEDAMQIKIDGTTLQEVIIHAIATIGEKIILRRFAIVEKNNNQSFGIYWHSNKRIASLVLFDGKVQEEHGKQVAMHVVAMNPKFVSRDEVSKEYLAQEKEILTHEAKNNPKNVGKPDNILEKMIEGRLNKQLSEMSLLDQQFVVDPNFKVSDFVKNNGGTVAKVIRYEVGEGIEKTNVDFAAEVMAQVNKK